MIKVVERNLGELMIAREDRKSIVIPVTRFSLLKAVYYTSQIFGPFFSMLIGSSLTIVTFTKPITLTEAANCTAPYALVTKSYYNPWDILNDVNTVDTTYDGHYQHTYGSNDCLASGQFLVIQVRRILYITLLLMLLQIFQLVLSLHVSGIVQTPPDWKYRPFWGPTSLLLNKAIVMGLTVYQCLLLSLFEGQTPQLAYNAANAVYSGFSTPSFLWLLTIWPAEEETKETPLCLRIICFPLSFPLMLIQVTIGYVIAFAVTSMYSPLVILWFCPCFLWIAVKAIMKNQIAIPLIIKWGLTPANVQQYNAIIEKHYSEMLQIKPKSQVVVGAEV